MGKVIGQSGLSLIKQYEGLKLKAYLCPAGVPTIGYGHTKTAYLGQVINEAQADSLLRSDLKWAESAVNRYVKVLITQNQFDALVSFVFNVGERAFRGSTLLKRLNSMKFDEVPAQLMRWNKAGGRVLSGLARRRQSEAELFMRH
jgi:lysozyme